MTKSTSTTPDPEMTAPFNENGSTQGGGNPRNETAGCPTGLAGSDQVKQVQRQGGGGAPGTGAQKPVSKVPYSPGEGVTEDQEERSGQQD